MRGLLFVLLAFFWSTPSAFAKCFNFGNQSPEWIGPVKLWAAPEKVCVTKNAKAFNLVFSDGDGVLAEFSSAAESVGSCTGFCRTYVLDTGVVNGAHVDPRGTVIDFHINDVLDFAEGELKISYPRNSVRTYQIEE